MKNYEINDGTLALIPITDDVTKVYENEDEFYVFRNSNKIMEDSCEYFGSSLSGRKKGTASMIGVSYKAPVIVEESNELIFFPLYSSRYNNTPWICLKHIKEYYPTSNDILVEFQNGKKISLNTSFGIVDNQVMRATRLESALRGRKVKKKVNLM